MRRRANLTKNDLSKNIEKLRHQLAQAAVKEPLSSPKIQHLSRRLDRLLNQYERLAR
ncbi:aspartyl-phosphate phosphatase Spo0E family protein [Sporolactobacillus sp. THM7-7]|nr:aspartyl-phosphate phosphatase Spo0E family protein [Sporolactobacillus sp. THM7-7]